MSRETRIISRDLRMVNVTVACVLANLAVIGVALVARSTIVSLLALLVLIALAAFRPVASVAAIPAVVGFVYEQIYVGNARFSPQEVLLITTIAGVGLNIAWTLVRSRSIRTIRSFVAGVRTEFQIFDATALALVVIGAISLATVALPAYRHESLRVFRWVILEPVIFYVMARWYLQDRGMRQLAIISFAAGAVLVAIIGLIDSLSGHGLAVEGVTRISGVYPQPNALALYLERPFVLVVGIATVFRRNLGWKWLALACVIGASLILTFSRGAVLATGFAIIVVLLIGERRRLAVLASVLGVALIGGLALTASARIDNLFSGGSGSLRLALWHSAIGMIRDHPIFGIGLDQFLYVYSPRYIRPQAWSERFTSHPHDIILDTWLSLGIMGIVLALVFLGILAWSTVRLARHRNGLGVAAVGVMFVGIMHGLVDNGYFLPDLALIFWFMTAIIASEALDSVRFGQRET